MSIRSAAMTVLVPGIASAVVLTSLVNADAHPAVVLFIALATVTYGGWTFRLFGWL